VRWLYLLAKLGLGACLADDMGLGKTIQVLSLLLVLKRRRRRPAAAQPAGGAGIAAGQLGVGNRALRARPEGADRASVDSAGGRSEGNSRPRAAGSTWSSPATARCCACRGWPRLLAAGGARRSAGHQEPDAKQTRAVKKLKAGARLALTGTPVENRLGDLWSIFDFVNPGLLGTAKEFTSFAKRLANGRTALRPLRELVRPYILRRLKTDKTVIADLPDKTEIKAFCRSAAARPRSTSRRCAELAEQLEETDGIQRKGLVLAFLMRFKQICNHPSQWLGDGAWARSRQRQMGALRDIAEVVAAKQEKMLVFTQFREVTAPLAAVSSARFSGGPAWCCTARPK
jgi:hypothetical protein